VRKSEYKKVRGRWYYRDGKFHHLHASGGDGRTTYRSYPPLKASGFGAYCMQCKKTAPDEVQTLFDLQKLKGKV